MDRKTLTDILMTYLAGNRYLRTKRQEEKAEQHRQAMAEKAEKASAAESAAQEPDSAPEDGKKKQEDRTP